MTEKNTSIVYWLTTAQDFTYFPDFEAGRRPVEDTERILSAEPILELDSVGSLSMFAQSISNLQKIQLIVIVHL